MNVVIAIRGFTCVIGRSEADINHDFNATRCNVQPTQREPFPFSNNVFVYILVNNVKREDISFAAGTKDFMIGRFYEALENFMKSVRNDAEKYLDDLS